MPDRRTSRLLRFYVEHQEPIDALIGTAAWAGLLAFLIITGS